MTRTAISPRFATKTLSNTTVWLAEMGHPREVPESGPALVAPWPTPDGTRFVEVRRIPVTGSTNADLLELVRRGEAVDGLVLVTDHQTSGRGRQGRVWQDRPSGSLLVSVLTRVERGWAPLVPLATGLAAVDALATTAGVEARLKWPNDVLVPAADERKLAGILAEAATNAGDLWVVVGMGCNLRWPDERPPELADRLVALADLGVVPDRRALLDAWLRRLDRRLAQLADESERGGLLEDYRRSCLSIGRAVSMETPGGVVDGVVEGIADDGALLLLVDGSVRRLDAGDVHHR